MNGLLFFAFLVVIPLVFLAFMHNEAPTIRRRVKNPYTNKPSPSKRFSYEIYIKESGFVLPDVIENATSGPQAIDSYIRLETDRKKSTLDRSEYAARRLTPTNA